MSEEPRRSVRSTKGYHSHKEQEIEGNVDQPKKKAAAKKGANRKGAEPSPAPEANEDGDIIRCICGATTQDGDEEGEEWIACEKCTTWQHNVCMGVPTENVDELPDYFCEVCRPEDHRELLAAVKRGEKIWEKRREAYEAEKKARKNRKGKGGGTKKKKAEPKSTAQRTNGQVKDSPVTSGREGSANAKKETPNRAGATKRKAREESHDQDPGKIKQRKVSDVSAVRSTPATPATPAAVASTPVFATPAPPPPPPAAPVAPIEDQQVPKYTAPQDLPMDIADLKDSEREGLAKLLRKNIEVGLKSAADNGHFTASASNSIEQNALRLALELERATHDAHANDKDAYVSQCKLVAINLKRNQELFGKLLSRELSVNQLAVMSEDDMKSSKQRREDEEEMARAERQSIMVKEDGPRLRRTHKGEELVEEDNYGEVPSREQRDPNSNMAGRSRENSFDEVVEPPSDVEYATRPKQPLNINTQAEIHERKPSVQASEFDYNKVASKLPTPTNVQPSRRTSGPVPIAREALDDPEVDRLLEDGPESPPYSPKEDSDPSVVWYGQVGMSAIGKFDASAKHVGGANLMDQPEPSYVELLGRKLAVTGRIEPEKADEYVCGLRYSPGSDIIVVSVTPRGELATQEFTKIFEYFMEKNRWGVIGNRMGPSSVRDVYLVPLEAGNARIPLFMSSLEVNKLPENREERMMLLVIVYREESQPGNFDGNQSPSLMTHPQRQMSQVYGPAASPLTQHGSFKSPTDPAQQKKLEDQRRGEAIAREILGPEYIDAPTVQFILPQAFQMVAKEWHVIKEIYMNDVRARTDLQHLAQLLADRANGAEQQQQQQQPQNNDA